MAGGWYYAHDGVKIGPFSPAQLKDLADAGAILPVDTVWKEGIEQGVPASRVKNLFPLSQGDVRRNPPSAGNKPAAVNAASSPPEPDAKSSPGEPGSEPTKTTSLDAEPTAVAENTASMPEAKAAAMQAPAKSPQKPAFQGRAVALKGADIVGQDGAYVRYRMKCVVCGHKDRACHTIPIANRLTKANFFCPKCRKRRDVAIQCFASH